jgi:nitroreductase
MSQQLQATQDFATILKERRSVRHYDPSVKISREELTSMLELAITAPSSSNRGAFLSLMSRSSKRSCFRLRLTRSRWLNRPQLSLCSWT